MPQPADNLRIRLSRIGSPVIKIPAPSKEAVELSSSDMKIQYDVQVTVRRPDATVDVCVSMTYLYLNMQVFSGSLTSTFEVVGLASFINANEGEDRFRIENDFLPMLINIAFSTTRGFFARELQDTALAPYPFPIISMDSIQKRTRYQLI